MKLKTYTQRCVTLTKLNSRMHKLKTKNSQNQYGNNHTLHSNITLLNNRKGYSRVRYKDINFSSSESDIVNK
jgi:hypothetical protein